MNAELSYIQAQCRRQDLLRAARQEHRFEAAQSQKPPRNAPKVLSMRGSARRRALAFRHAAVGKV